MFQMAEDLAEHLALRDDGNDPQRPALAKQAAVQRGDAVSGRWGLRGALP